MGSGFCLQLQLAIAMVRWSTLARAALCAALLAAAAGIQTANQLHPDLLPQDCGRRQILRGITTQPFIFGEGNTTAYYGQYPWQSHLLKYDRQVGAYVHQCGAVVITSRHVITAAHCVQHVARSDLLVRVGELRLGRSDAESGRQEFGVASSTIPYSFTGAPGLPDDIALIRLRLRPGDTMQFGAYVTPACLPAQGSEYETNLACEVSGWGSTSDFAPLSRTLRRVEVPLVSDAFCATPEIYEDRFAAGKMFCAGLTLGGPDSCHGDSGGPLVCEQEGRFIAYGLVSSGDLLGCGRRPGLYARVEHYIGWMIRRLQVEQSSNEDELFEMIAAPQCGAVTFRPPSSVGAALVETTKQFPWVVLVKVTAGDGVIWSACGGMIVSSRWVLTAFVCVKSNSQLHIQIGSLTGGSSFPVEIEVDIIELQPRRTSNNEPSFALLHTKRPIAFSDDVSAICLPEDTSLAPLRHGVDLIFVGWGVAKPTSNDNKLKWARLRVVDLEECRASYSSKVVLKFFSDDTFCTQFLQKNDDFQCGVTQGDTGGVFMDRVTSGGREHWRVLGTAVSGPLCGGDRTMDINAALGPALHWVRSVVDGAEWKSWRTFGSSHLEIPS